MFSVDKKKSLEVFSNNSSEKKDIISYNEEEPAYDITEKYYFLSENNNPLAQTFGVFNDTENNKAYNIFLCIYRVNIDCKIPFIEFLIDIDNVPQFPNVPNFSCIETDATEEHNTYFMNKCLTKLLEILKLHEIFGIELLEKMYKGFVQQDDSNIFVVFECFPETDFHPKENVQWVILDELLFKMRIHEKDIDPLLTSFFKKQQFMTELFTDDSYEHQYPLPFLMYLCEKNKEDKKYYNVIQRSIIDLTTLGVSFLGDCYYFSSVYLPRLLQSPVLIPDIETKSQEQAIPDIETKSPVLIPDIQRYAVFTDKSIYILRDISQITEIQIETFLKNNSTNDILTIYFNEDGLSLWCVKSSDTFTRI